MRKADVYKMIASTGTLQQVNSLLESGETPDSLDEDNRRLIDHILDYKNKDLFMKLENVLWSRNSKSVNFGSFEIDSGRYIKLLKIDDEEFNSYIFNLSNEDLANISDDNMVYRALNIIYNTNNDIMNDNIKKNSDKLRILLKKASKERVEGIVSSKERGEFSPLYELLDQGVTVGAKEALTLKLLTGDSKTLFWLDKSGYKDFNELSINGQIKVLEHIKSNGTYSSNFYCFLDGKNYRPLKDYQRKIKETEERIAFINAILKLGKPELVGPLFAIFGKDEEIVINTDLPIQIIVEVAKFEAFNFITYTDPAKAVELKLKDVDKDMAPLYKRILKLEAQNRELKRNMEKYVKAWEASNWDDD